MFNICNRVTQTNLQPAVCASELDRFTITFVVTQVQALLVVGHRMWTTSDVITVTVLVFSMTVVLNRQK